MFHQEHPCGVARLCSLNPIFGGEKSRDHWVLICGLFVTEVLKRHWNFENKDKSNKNITLLLKFIIKSFCNS